MISPDDPQDSLPSDVSYIRMKPARPASFMGSGNKIWLVSFTDIMGLMLIFFVLTFAMSEKEILKFQEFAGALYKRPASFQGPPESMGDNDDIALPREGYKRGLDPTYLIQILERKKLDIPNLRDLTIAPDQRGGVRLSLPTDRFIDMTRGQTTRGTRRFIGEVSSLLAGMPNRVMLVVDWRGDPVQGMMAGLAQGAVIAQSLRQAGLNNDITYSVTPLPLPRGANVPRVHVVIDLFSDTPASRL